LQTWYGHALPALSADQKEIASAARGMLAGDAGERALYAWALGWVEAQRASGTDWMAPVLAELLDEPYAAVRYIGVRSLRSLGGFGDFSFDYIGSARERREGKERALSRWKRDANSRRVRALLINGDGTPMREEIARLRSLRVEKNMFLAE
jgi:hypothetical protein